MMTDQTPRLSRTVLRRATLAAVTAGAVLITGLGLEATLAPAPRGPEPVGVGTPLQSEAEALAAARRTGKQVEVLGLRTERREILAAPDGTFTAREYTEPVHAVQGGKWVDVDKSLVKRPDGSITPKATTVSLTFSGGEAGKPFVTMRRGTHEMSLSWPHGKLTAPVVDGDTATYADALPGVDLKVRAEADGFGHLLVVKTKEAAADPRLQRLDMGLKTKGLTYKKDATGALTAEDSTVGGTVFQSGRPCGTRPPSRRPPPGARVPRPWPSPSRQRARTPPRRRRQPRTWSRPWRAPGVAARPHRSGSSSPRTS
ncbi:hypothetical protein [Streptomyces sp. NPDC059949]|uniref:hypothetical protein n=1 Tax=Streptomyces sp. NPDC059949 TaxID=3347013 RepID=UPI0036624B84